MANLTIRGTVGPGGDNRPEDWQVIAALLGGIPTRQGGTRRRLVLRAATGAEALLRFQQVQVKLRALAAADGCARPGDATMALLNALSLASGSAIR